ncbi:MAG TPA: NAD(P)H-binding protein [Vicinamibacteria bacterium]|nr:NAD(P)H-binding protein [Vicinamibacteria bacterium]
MRVVVAGGTGFIGRHVVDELLGRGHEVSVTTRDPGTVADRWGGRARYVQAFAGDHVSLGKAFTRADVVVHAIQFPNHPVEDPARGRTYMEVDGRGTPISVETAKKLGVRRFVYLSGAGAGQGRPQPWFRAKDAAEAAIRASGLEHGILRPSWIYGPGDRSLNRFASFVRWLPFVPQIGDGKTPVWPVYVKDVARCVADLATREDAKDVVHDLGGPERMTMDDVVRTLQAHLGKRRPIVHHPVALMKLLVLPLQVLPDPILSPGAVDFVTQEVEVDPRPAMEYFGFPFRKMADAIREYLR